MPLSFTNDFFRIVTAEVARLPREPSNFVWIGTDLLLRLNFFYMKRNSHTRQYGPGMLLAE